MKPSRSLGNASLMVAAGGFAAVEAALGQKWIDGPAWRILGQAFEAATVGGVADWFAVTALFREVPLPGIRRHTNIVVKNRARIVSGIADMVQNRWLSPDVIREHLARFSASRHLLDYMSDEKRAEGALSLLRDLVGQIARGIDEPEVSSFLDRVLKDQLAEFDLAGTVGRWIGGGMRRGDHHAVWETVLSALEESAQGAEFREAVRKMLSRAIHEYREGGFLRGIAFEVAETLDIVNKDEAADALLRNVVLVVREARDNPGHPLRERMDGILLEFADGLAAGDPEAVQTLEKLRNAFVEAADTRVYITKSLARLRETVDSELSKPGSDLDRLIRRIFRERFEGFREDANVQSKVDAWVRNVATGFVEKRHAAIGEMVRGSLEKLSDLDLVSQIEEKVGTDLQYIRLNGAIVGGLVGAVLAVGKWVL
jgi:uncharacterized membrane-anchored protein YjiN (DUF445 family)